MMPQRIRNLKRILNSNESSQNSTNVNTYSLNYYLKRKYMNESDREIVEGLCISFDHFEISIIEILAMM
jgi:hypothetical protein